MKKDMFGIVRGMCIAVAALLLAGCASARLEPTPASGPVQVKLAMGFVPNVQFAPVYVALERGYFAAEGIELELDYGMEHDLLKLVGMGEMSFVIGSGDQVILARSQGLPVVYVANWYRHFPVAVASLSPLEGAQDLVGMDVGIPGLYGASYLGWQALIDAEGIEPTAVNLLSIGYTQVESLVTGQVDAAVVYAMNEYVRLREQGHEVSMIYVQDYIDLVSNGLITNEQTIAGQPELVRGMVRALVRGIGDTLADPEAAFAICREAIPEIDDQGAPLQRAVLEECLRYWEGERLGYSDPAAWEAAVAFMRQVGLISADVDAADMFSNAFVPEPQP